MSVKHIIRTNENFQSIKAKREAFWNLVESRKPDIVLGCETWLKSTITNQEVMSPGYEVYRNDRSDGYGGVLIAVKSHYISSIVDIDFHSEPVAVQIYLTPKEAHHLYAFTIVKKI